MARASSKRRKSTRAHARRSAPRRPATYSSAEDLMFFPRLRKRAKWIFALLALVFAIGFIGFGVGAGGSGIGDFLSQIFHSGSSSSSGPSVEDAQAKLKKNPKDAAAQLELAKAYTDEKKPTQAIAAYQAYVQLKPNDANALQALAGLWATEATRRQRAAEQAYLAQQGLDPGQVLQAPGSPFSQALSGSPLTSELQQQASTRFQQAFSALQQAYTEETSVLKKLVSVQPDDTLLLLHLGQTAERAQDTKTAIAA